MSIEMKDSGINGIGMIPNSWHIKSLGAFFSENTKVNYAFSSSNALQFKYGEIVQKTNNNRDLEEQKRELIAIKDYKANLDFEYTKVFISNNDKIIPTKSQVAFWGIEPNLKGGHCPFFQFKKWSELL